MVTSAITHNVRFDESQRKYVHSCLPLGFMVTFTEATEVYTEFLNVLSKTPSTHMNKGSNAQLNISPISQDRAQEIRNGARAVFGNKV